MGVKKTLNYRRELIRQRRCADNITAKLQINRWHPEIICILGRPNQREAVQVTEKLLTEAFSVPNCLGNQDKVLDGAWQERRPPCPLQ